MGNYKNKKGDKMKRIRKHKGKVGLALLLVMLAHYGKLFAILGIGIISDTLNVYIGSEIGLNAGSIIIAIGTGLIVWKIIGGK